MAENSGVTYEFKELFDRFERALSEGFSKIDRRLDEVNRKLDSKADIRSVVAVEAKIADLEHRLEDRFEKIDERFKPLEMSAASSAGAGRIKVWAGNAAVLLASSTVGALLYYIAAGGHS